MELGVQKRLAAHVLKCSEKRVWFDETRLEEIKEAITKADIRALASKGAIQIKHKQCKSRGRARRIHEQKRRGRRRGHGSRKGNTTARDPRKRKWINTVRAQRRMLQSLKENERITRKDYQDLYKKSKGGFFRSRRHIEIYLEERGLVKKK